METKRCSRCRLDKPLDAFNVMRRRGREGQQSYCRQCQADRYATHPEHKQQIRQRSKEQAEAIRAWIEAYKLKYGCAQCGYRKCGAALEAHHRDAAQKEFSISAAVRQRFSLARVQMELSQCEILCANCHREHHASVTQIG